MKKDITFEIIKDIESAQKVFLEFSPKETLYDTWEFRHCFYKYFNFELRFYVGSVDGERIGVLPLQYNSELQHLEFFGTYFMETNQVFIKPGFESYIPDFYAAIDEPCNLEYINNQGNFFDEVPPQDYKFTLPLNKYKNFEDYFNTEFTSKSRANIKKKLKEIEDQNTITIKKGIREDMETLFVFSIKTFRAKDDQSSFEFPFRKEIYRDFLDLPFEYDILVFFINGKKQAVSFSFFYKDHYIFLNTGANIPDIPNLGTYTYLKNIENAFKSGKNIFDAGVGPYSWKERFHLTKTPQYQIKK
jgi:CelD/BcsL family acetyltransferase involved in cellulose biosynthesis